VEIRLVALAWGTLRDVAVELELQVVDRLCARHGEDEQPHERERNDYQPALTPRHWFRTTDLPPALHGLLLVALRTRSGL
jgi:hypothetical protein